MDFNKIEYKDKPATFVVQVATTNLITLSTLVEAEVQRYRASHDLTSVTIVSGNHPQNQKWMLFFSKSARDIAERLDNIEKKLDSIESAIDAVNRNL